MVSGGVALAAESFADVEDLVPDADAGAGVVLFQFLKPLFQPVQLVAEGGNAHFGVIFAHFFASFCFLS